MKKEIKNFVMAKKGLWVESKKVFSYPVHSHSYYEMTFYMPFEGFIRINGKRPRKRPRVPLLYRAILFRP